MSEKEKRICPKCGNQIPAEAKSCPFCWAESENFEEVKSKGESNNNEQSTGAKPKYCNECENIIPDDAQYCPYCSTNQTESIPQTKLCPQCGNECQNDSLFCNKCGYNFKQNKKCPNCGTPYNQGDTFCPECGKKLINTSNNQTVIKIETNNQAVIEDNYSDIETCKYCGSKIPEGVKKCPHCGEWLTNNYHSGFGCGMMVIIFNIIITVISMAYIADLNIPIISDLFNLGFIWGLFFSIFYFVPSLIAELRNCENHVLVFLLNWLLGWTGIGWILALIFAFCGRRKNAG